MKDMKAIITRAMLAFIAFIMIIIVYAFVGTSEDKGKIRKDEDRIVEYIKEKVELQNLSCNMCCALDVQWFFKSSFCCANDKA